jgi:hypothetical protein
MRQLAVRLAAILILALGLAPVASAEVWTFAHFAETSGSGSTPNSFDSVLYLMNQGNPMIHHCWVVLLNESNRNLTVNGVEICPEVLDRAASPCLINIDGFVRFKFQDRIVQLAGATWPVVLGEVRLKCDEPLAGLNASLWVTNYHSGAFDASYAVDDGKILP